MAFSTVLARPRRAMALTVATATDPRIFVELQASIFFCVAAKSSIIRLQRETAAVPRCRIAESLALGVRDVREREVVLCVDNRERLCRGSLR